METEDSIQNEPSVMTETVETIADTLTTIKTSTPVKNSSAKDDLPGVKPDMGDLEVIVHAVTEGLADTEENAGSDTIPESTILEATGDESSLTMSQNEEQVAVTMAHSLSLPLDGEAPTDDLIRRKMLMAKIKEVMHSRNSDMMSEEKIQRIHKVLKNGSSKAGDEPPRFMFYVRSRQFTLKCAPELGWDEDVVCEPTKSEDPYDDSLLGNWRRVAAAEDVYTILNDIHEATCPHKNYRSIYFDVCKKYSRIPRHICKEFVELCPNCKNKKDRSSIRVNTDGTPARPLKRKQNFSPMRVTKITSRVKLEDFKLTGLIAAPFTPFTKEGDLNLRSISKYVDVLRADGVTNVFVLGTTAEGPSLTIKERKMVAGEWVKCARGKLDAVIVQVGTENLKETQELAVHAGNIGASAIAVLPPVYFKPQTPEHLVNYLKQVSSVAPHVPLFYYHIPMRTGVNFSMMDILRSMETDPVPSFKGAKFVTQDLTDFSLCVNVSKGKFQMIYALDGMILPSMTLGGEAYVGSTYNFAGRVYTRMIEAFNNGNLEGARAEQFRMHAFLDVMNRYEKLSGPATLKYTMSLSRFDVGPPRPPQSQMSLEDLKALRIDLTEIGFFDWIK
ncbi:uncharacterized protein [Asterias amurensis]|uniref:uncharacterized protein n=1 Tax=Asterias amurensis TaxID=7602 RepID=UPI003AB8AEFC